MAKFKKTPKDLSTNTNSDLDFLLAQLEESSKVSANIREKVANIKLLKQQVNEMIKELSKTLETEQINALTKSIKTTK
jgi:hypothetical protein